MSSSVSAGPGPPEAPGRAARARRRGRWIALGIFTVCAAPVVAGYIAYYFLPTSGRVNYGELMPVKPLPDAALARPDGTRFRLSDLKGKWILLHADAAACSPGCEAKLYAMRQVRLAQGKDMDRIERLWLVLDEGEPRAELARLTEGAIVARGAGRDLLGALPARAALTDHVFLVDPLGNLVLRFPPDAEPKRMIKDLQRLLKYSGIG